MPARTAAMLRPADRLGPRARAFAAMWIALGGCSLASETAQPAVQSVRLTLDASADPEIPPSEGLAVDRALPIAPMPKRLVFPSTPMPTDGVLQLHSPDGLAPSVRVFTQDMVEVPGAVGNIEGLWVWRPSAPLEAGSYTVELADGSPSMPLTVEGTHDETLPDFTSDPSASLVTTFSSSACCGQWSGDAFLSDAFCFGTNLIISIELNPGLSSPAPLSALSQLAFQVRPMGAPDALEVNHTQPQSWGAEQRLRFQTQAVEYCYELEVTDLVTRRKQILSDLTPRCAKHGALGTLGTSKVEPTGAQLDPLFCHTPPPDYIAQWCTNAATACELVPAATGCSLRDVCEGVPLPDAGARDAGERDAGERDAGHTADASIEERSATKSASCSATPRSRGARGGVLLVLAILLGLGVCARSRSRVAWMLAIALGSASLSTRAHAEPSSGAALPLPPTTMLPPQVPSAAPQLLNAAEPIPGDGGLLIAVTANSNIPLVQVESQAARGTTIGGTVTALEGLWVWRATTPLQSGEYSVTLSNTGATAGPSTPTLTTFTAIESFAPSVDGLIAVPSARTQDTVLESACCQWLVGGTLSPGACATTRVMRSAIVALSFRHEMLGASGQFLFRARPDGSDASSAFRAASTLTELTFIEQAESYCYAIDALEITTGTLHEDVMITPSCVPDGGLAPLGEQALDVQDSSLEATLCNVPPTDLEARWCELNADACERSAATPGCQGYGFVCRGEPLPMPFGPPIAGAAGVVGFAGTGGFGGVGPVGGAAGVSYPFVDPTGEQPDDVDRKPPAEEDDALLGCSIASARDATRERSAPWLSALAIAALATRRARRRRQS